MTHVLRGVEATSLPFTDFPALGEAGVRRSCYARSLVLPMKIIRWSMLTALLFTSVTTGMAACSSGDPVTNEVGDDDDSERDGSSFTQPDARRNDASGSSSSGQTGSSSSGGESSSSSSGATTSSSSSSGSTSSSSSSSSGSAEAGAFVPPTCDGVIGATEYGPAADNTTSSGAQQWSITWDDENLYLGVSNAAVAEGIVLYLDAKAGGSTTGQVYDSQAPGTLPFAADLLAYVKSNYDDHRLASVAGVWGPNVTAPEITMCVAAGVSNVREVKVPWSIVGGRPASFSFLAYVTSQSGTVYGELPLGNPNGAIGTSQPFTKYFSVASSNAPALPFAEPH